MTLPMHEQQTANSNTLRRMSAASNSSSSKSAFQLHACDEAARRADLDRARCLEALAASMVQEMNQPLSALVTNAEACLRMLSATSLHLEGARDKALRMLADASRAAALMQSMWSLFVKTEANNESVDLNEAARKALLLYSQNLNFGKVIVRRELQADLPRISGDFMQLQQAILSLVANAAESMSEIDDRPRELVLRTESGEGCVRLSVRDTGNGFNPRDAHRLFEAFYTTKANGAGIGLFLSRWIIENHRGTICAAVNEGPGATFLVSIPCQRA